MNTVLEQINSAGFVFVKFAVPMLVQSAVLIIVLLLADLLLRKKVRAVFRYWLWMLVLLKLILPTTLSSPVSLGSWFGDELASIKVSDTSIVAQPVNLPQITETGTAAVAGTPRADVRTIVTLSPGAKPVVAEAAASPMVLPAPLTRQGIVFLVWTAVVAAMGLLLLQRAVFVTGLVAQAQNPTQLMNDAFRFCCGQMGIKNKISLKVSANTASPAVCGLFRPIILVPQNLAPTLGSSHLRPVLLHELAHIKRGDLWLNLVQTILQIIYFYNPLLWLANSIIRRVREQAVDEVVQVAMGANASQYPLTLVDVAKIAFNRPILSLRLIGVVESKSALKGRIERMLNRPIPKTAKLGIIGLIVLLIFAAVFLPMAKAKSKPPEFVIKGTVTDADTGRPVAGAKIGDERYAEGKQWTTTDANGYYSYNTWYEEHNIKCEAPGYKTQNKLLYTKLLSLEKEKVLDFDLEHSNSPQNTVEGKKQQSQDINAKKKEILEKLVVLEEHRKRFQQDLDATERALGEVRDRWGITDFEEHNYPPPIVERLNRLQKEQDDCTLEISQLKAKADNLKKEAQTEQEKKELKDAENHLVELQAKFDALEKMRTEAAQRKSEIDLARIQYKQRAAIRDERLQRLNEVKARIEKLRLMYDNPEVFDTLAEVEDKSNAAAGTIDVAVEDFKINPYPAGGLYTVTVAIRNKGSQEAPPFRLNFYQGDPANNLDLHGKPQTGSHGAGPIKPGDVWNESSSPFALKEGLNEIAVVLDTSQSIAESDETNNRAFMRLVVKDGQIKENSVSYSPQQKAENPSLKTDVQVEQTDGGGQQKSVEDLHKSLIERKDILQKKLQTVERVYNAGRADSNQLLQAKVNLLQVESELSETPQKRIDILKQIVSLYLEQEKHTKILLEAGRSTGDELDKLKLLRLNAEEELAKAKAGLEKAKSEKTNVQVEIEGVSKVSDKDKATSENLAAAETSGKTPEKIVEQAVMTISTCAETDPQVKQSLESLQGLDEQEVVKELVKFLDSGKNTVRRSSIYILWKGNLESIAPAVPHLQKLCSHEEEYTRGMAALALGARKVEPAFDTLCNMTLNDSSAYARRCAAYALGLMGNPEAKNILEKALKDSDINVRSNAEAALTMLSQVEKPKSEKTKGQSEQTAQKEHLLRVYEVNRSVADFPKEEDFSTPEAAYAAINRVSASGEVSGWIRVSTKKLAEQFAGQKNKGEKNVDPEWAKVLLNATILEVRILNENRAMVVAELPQQFSSKPVIDPIDVRHLELEDGRWLNIGNDRFATIEQARVKFSRFGNRTNRQSKLEPETEIKDRGKEKSKTEMK